MPIDESYPIYIGSNDRRTNDDEKIVARSLDKFPNWVQLIDLFTSVTGQRETTFTRGGTWLWPRYTLNTPLGTWA